MAFMFRLMLGYRDADLLGRAQAVRRTKRQGLAETDGLCADVPR